MEYDKIATGNRATEARKNKNLNQKEVSAAIGIHQTTYSKFENGQYKMDIEQMMKLCDLYEISIAWLVGENILPPLTVKEWQEVQDFAKFLISKRK